LISQCECRRRFSAAGIQCISHSNEKWSTAIGIFTSKYRFPVMRSKVNFSARPYLLAETNWGVVRDADYELAVLPWGATEAHNYHLPYATDNIQVDHVAAEAAGEAWSRGARVVVLPCIPFGVNTGQLDIKLCMNLLPSTQLAILRDVSDVLTRAGLRKLVILNGHGGNHFKTMIRELSFHFPRLFVCGVNWYEAAPARDYFEDLGDHAGEMETSAMLNIAPQWVRPLREAGTGSAAQPRLTAMRQGWVSTQRPWSKVTEDTGVGDPAKANADKGERYLAACVANLADFLVDLAKIDVDELYQ
jgi:creatinine amidohydrolase